MVFLELHQIFKSYFLGNDEFPVLKGIDLNFDKGEFVSILGESGGGKSTLMNIVGGLDREFDGQVIVDGKVLDHRNEKQLDEYRRSTIGHIYQSYNLIPHLTVLDNVLVSLDMTTLSAAEKKARAEGLLKKVGLADQIRKYPKQLSGGQKQRVAIARALASDPQIIIADEPTGALDSKNTQEVLELMDEIAKDGKLVIAVTHSSEVANHGTRIVHMEDGKIDRDEHLKDPYPIPEDPTHIQAQKLPARASYSFSFKHLMYNFWRNSLIMLGVAIGLFAVMIFSGLGNGVNGYIQDQVNSIANPRVIQVLKNTTGKKMNQQELLETFQNIAGDPQAGLIDNQQVQRVAKLKGVQSVEKGYTLPTYRLELTSSGKTQSGSSLSTWNAMDKKSSLKKGHAPKQGEIVIGKQEAAQFMGAKNYQKIIGKKMTLSFNWVDGNGQPVAISVPVKVVGLVDSSTAGGSAVNYETIRQAIKKQNADDRPNFLAVKVKNFNQVQTVANRIDGLRSGNKRIFGSITVGSMLKRINRYVKLASNVLSGVAAVSLLVSALMIIVTMYMSVSERTKEIGILRALGERKVDIRRLFTSESILIGLFAAVLALVITLLATWGINSALYGLIKYNIIQLTVGNVIFAFVAALVISFLAALLPARRAAKLNPIEALAAD
ncbi:ABC transporter ATP-binding protein/permease [Limosilactobacillus caecicola]|uniref:ABC transporter ATP-binding protein/permease n=1 Tax=Limosilactobacillus caecicola TaxID=2941332 RepID=UPI00203D1B4B|nr:ABC transporter ATP-binding protein/permease [Limosilactobacillus caecicola]